MAHWQRFLPAVQREDILSSGMLDDPNELASNISDLYEIVATEIMPLKTSAEWLELFSAMDIPCAPVVGIEDLLTDRHLRAVGLFREYEHPSEGRIREIRPPFNVQGSEASDDLPPPLVGQDTESVLKAMGLDEAEIRELIAAKIVSTADSST
jgi:formyl-CoA transferase